MKFKSGKSGPFFGVIITYELYTTLTSLELMVCETANTINPKFVNKYIVRIFLKY